MRTLVVGPHPDDELLGCGGMLLRRANEGGIVGWLLMTGLTIQGGWTDDQINDRRLEISQVRQELNIQPKHFYSLNFQPAELDQISMSKLVGSISVVFNQFLPNEVLLPHPGDVHSDHRVTFDAAIACTKWFRYPSVKRVLTYETISETEYGLNATDKPFSPNLFIDISQHLNLKLKLISTYKSEFKDHPFPRSIQSVRALALLRGSQMGVHYAEAFQILRQYE